MGCAGSSHVAEFTVNDQAPGQGPDAQRDFDKLRLDKRTIDRYYGLFIEIDKDGSGEIDLDEFYRFFDVDRSPFSDRVFSIMDEDGSGEIDFREFVLCLWNYLSFDTTSLTKFAFTLFDLDGSGQLDVTEVRELVMEVYGDAFEASYRVQRILDRIDTDGDGEVTYAEFREFNRKYPAILFPAFRMQQELRRRVFGEAYWNKVLQERAKMGAAGVASIWEILNAMDANAYAAKMEEMLADEAAKRWQPPEAAGAAAGAGDGGQYGFDNKKKERKKRKDKDKSSRRSSDERSSRSSRKRSKDGFDAPAGRPAGRPSAEPPGVVNGERYSRGAVTGGGRHRRTADRDDAERY